MEQREARDNNTDDRCDGCADTVKKPKLDQHRGRCHASFTCLGTLGRRGLKVPYFIFCDIYDADDRLLYYVS